MMKIETMESRKLESVMSQDSRGPEILSIRPVQQANESPAF